VTKFKITRIKEGGGTTTEIAEAADWYSLISMRQYIGVGPIVKIEVVGSTNLAIDLSTGEML